ncbi:hypothetical protein KKG48_02045 [Patescibacteria group bacterium]|nr:hypothetical protein [Patescibacteria group bacterium]
MLILRNGLPYLGKLVAFKPDVGIVVLKIESHKPEFVDIDIDEIVAVHTLNYETNFLIFFETPQKHTD